MHPASIGPFKIEHELGRGGMGVVYLATDTRLDRPVAIKALPADLAADPDRLARFQREAKVLAALNHPNVGGIHGLELTDGQQYLVLEYIEGQTLAAHTGRRNIAELLLERGARLDIFAAAMLGQTETVKAMIAAAPGIQRNPGPHGITLLSHARAGGEAAKQTVAYLEGLGDADFKPKTEPLTDQEKQAYVGRFESPALGKGTVEIKTNKNGDLTIAVNGQSVIVMHHTGDHAFFPAGAPAVRIAFTNTGSGIESLAIVDHVLVLTASRIP